MLARTDQPYAPWHLIEGDSKRYARVKVIETVIERIEQGMRQWGMEPPKPLVEDAPIRTSSLVSSWSGRFALPGMAPAASMPDPSDRPGGEGRRQAR